MATAAKTSAGRTGSTAKQKVAASPKVPAKSKAAAQPQAPAEPKAPAKPKVPAKPKAKVAAKSKAKAPAKPRAEKPVAPKVKGPASYFPSIEKTYGKPVSVWLDVLTAAGERKHMELVTLLKTEHGLGHGHANALVAHFVANK